MNRATRILSTSCQFPNSDSSVSTQLSNAHVSGEFTPFARFFCREQRNGQIGIVWALNRAVGTRLTACLISAVLEIDLPFIVNIRAHTTK